MKKIIAILAVTLLAGCSSMGSGSSGFSSGAGRLGTDANASSSATPLQFQRQIFRPDGNLSLYHGG